MTEKTLTCGVSLVRLLESYGVNTVFGIPGVHTLELYRGLIDSPIRHVLPRHEGGASFMADGYARATGKPGVCFVITGPGVTNASTGIAEAYADSIPLLCVSSVGPVATLSKGWGELHEMDDQRAATASFTAFTATAMTPEEVPNLIHRAFSVFNSERPRPVHIEVPLDVLAMPSEGPWKPVALPSKPAPSHDVMKQAAALLKEAKQPFIFAGGGAIPASIALTKLAEKLAAPVLTTSAGNGVIPDSHPLALGPRLTSDVVREWVSNADVIIGIGTEWATFEGSLKGPLEIDGKLIRIDIDAKKLVDRLPAEVAIWSDSNEAASMLIEYIEDAGDAARDEVAKTVAELRAASHAALPDLNKKHLRIGEILKEVLPKDSYVVTDMTQIAYSFRANLGWELPGHFFHPKGFGTLGYGLPAAIGAKIGCPQQPVVILAGDGGLMYTVGEMMTAADEKANIVLIVWNNESLADIRDAFIGDDMTPIAVSPKAPDFIALAKAMGWNADRAATPEALRAQLAAGITAHGPTLIELREDDDF